VLSTVQRIEERVEIHGKIRIGARMEGIYLNNFGKDHQRKKFSKGNAPSLLKSYWDQNPQN